MRAASIVLRKDLRVLWRSPLLLGALLAYPIVIALLVGLIAGYASSKPRVAFVDEEHLPAVVSVAGHRFHLQTVIDDVAKQVTLVRLSPQEAARELANGKVVATITVPRGFLGNLETMSSSPSLILRTGSGGLAPRVTQQMQALVYQLNQKLQAGYIAANLQFVRLILHGGPGTFLGQHFDLLGLDGTQQELAKLPPSKRVAVIEHFVKVARVGLAQTGTALQGDGESDHADAAEVAWAHVAARPRRCSRTGSPLTVTFLALLLAAGAAAAEQDEGTIGRLRRGLVSLGELVWAKARARRCRRARARSGDRTGLRHRRRDRRRHRRRAVGTPAAAVRGRDARRRRRRRARRRCSARSRGRHGQRRCSPCSSCSRSSSSESSRAAPSRLAYWISLFLPFAHAVRWFGAALYDTSPWRVIGIETLWLIGIGLAFGSLARLAMRRLAA